MLRRCHGQWERLRDRGRDRETVLPMGKTLLRPLKRSAAERWPSLAVEGTVVASGSCGPSPTTTRNWTTIRSNTQGSKKEDQRSRKGCSPTDILLAASGDPEQRTQVSHVQSRDPQKLWDNTCALFQVSMLVLICYVARRMNTMGLKTGIFSWHFFLTGYIVCYRFPTWLRFGQKVIHMVSIVWYLLKSALKPPGQLLCAWIEWTFL